MIKLNYSLLVWCLLSLFYVNIHWSTAGNFKVCKPAVLSSTDTFVRLQKVKSRVPYLHRRILSQSREGRTSSREAEEPHFTTSLCKQTVCHVWQEAFNGSNTDSDTQMVPVCSFLNVQSRHQHRKSSSYHNSQLIHISLATKKTRNNFSVTLREHFKFQTSHSNCVMTCTLLYSAIQHQQQHMAELSMTSAHAER